MLSAANLHDFDVLVGHPFNSDNFDSYSQCGHFSGSVNLGVAASVDCPSKPEGSVVVVQIEGSNEILTICEIFVYSVYEG